MEKISLSMSSEALTLQQSVIGNFGASPANVVAQTRRCIEQGDVSSVPLKNNLLVNPVVIAPTEDLQKKRIEYPYKNISVENKTWFSNSQDDTKKPNSLEDDYPTINRALVEKIYKNGNYNYSIPRVPSSKGSGFKNHVFHDTNSPYPVNESSISENFEVESLYSEPNLDDVSDIEDMFQTRNNKNLNKSDFGERMIHNDTQVITSPMKPLVKHCSVDKSVGTDDSSYYQLLRQKGNIERYRSIAISYEAQIKSLQKQLEEKKNTLDSQNREQIKWDSVSKIFQNIIDSKMKEIRGLIDDLSERTRIGYEELKIEMKGAVTGLQKEIAELQVEVKYLQQDNIQLENEVDNIRLETLHKSKEWFQKQDSLHQATSNLDRISTEKNQLHQQRAVAEKEDLETIEADMKESMFDEIQKDKGTERIRKLEEEKSLSINSSDQEYQMKVLKSEKDKFIETLKIEFTILQKTLSQQLNQHIKDLDAKIKHSERAHVHIEELINTLKEERTAKDVTLACANEEKRTVSENLNKLKIVKADLVSKSSQAEQLLRENQTLDEALKKSERRKVAEQGNFLPSRMKIGRDGSRKTSTYRGSTKIGEDEESGLLDWNNADELSDKSVSFQLPVEKSTDCKAKVQVEPLKKSQSAINAEIRKRCRISRNERIFNPSSSTQKGRYNQFMSCTREFDEDV